MSASYGHPLNIPRSNTGRFESTAASTGYQLPVTPTSKSHHTGADSTDSVASSLSSCGSSIPPQSPGDLLFTDSRNSSRDRLKPAASPPTSPPSTMTFKSTLSTIKTPSSIGQNKSHSSQQNINNPGERDSLIMPPPPEYQKDAQTKGIMHAKGSESMQNIPGNEVNILHSPSVGGDFYSGSSTSLICQKPISQMEKANNGSWVEATTVLTQSQCMTSSSYISTFTSVTTSTRAAIISDCVDGSKTNQNDKTSTLMLCQSPVPYNNNRKQEQSTTFSTQHASQDEVNLHHSNISKTGPAPGASLKSPLNIHELNTGESVATEVLGSSTTGIAPTLQVPKSPRTPSMGHVIRHRFTTTLKPAKCDFCSLRMFRGLKCKECKFKCHSDCEQNVPPSCGLPEEMVQYYFNHLSKENSPILTRPISDSERPSGNPKGGVQGSYYGSGVNPPHPNKPYPDSSSNTSSCNSSTPSSPAVILDHITTNPTPPHSANIYPRGSGSLQFTFPNPAQTVIDPPPHCQPSQLGQYVSPALQQDTTLLGATSVSTSIYQQTPQSTQYTPNQQSQQISSPQHAPSQNPRSPNPLIISIQSNDSDKTLSSKLS